jgi:5-formyltetrahydrofolate cyclo-ligase
MSLPEVTAASALATYLANDGEVDPSLAVEELRARGTSVYAPTLTGSNMAFVELVGATRTNSFGIVEPIGTPVDISHLDVVVAPLVAADPSGTRIGRGRGYYDRALAQLRHSPRPGRPFLVGVAHAFQVVDALDRTEGDVPLDAVVTPTGVVRCTP